MHYLKCWFYNFLTVFFANQFLPGIEIISRTKLPHIGGDLLFALALGLINSLIYPVMKVVDRQIGVGRIGIACGSIAFAAYIILKFVPIIGFDVKSIEGFLLAIIVVGAGSFSTNYLEFKKNNNIPKPPEMPRFS